MREIVKKTSKKELEIMRVLWEHDAPMSSNQLVEELVNNHNWEIADLMTVLAHMTAKGIVCCDRTISINYYTALISENECNERTSILKKVLNRLAKNFVTPLYQGKRMSQKSIQELREYLSVLGEKSKREFVFMA